MRSMQVFEPAKIEKSPLRLTDVEAPSPGPGEVLVRVRNCGVCRTDLHVAEGDLPPHKRPIVPGHEVVGVVERLGPGCTRLTVGQRVGIAWLRETCGRCKFCSRGSENLCPHARFTGWDADGGYADFAVASEDFIYCLPDNIGDSQAAPLLCAGIIGYRALRRAGVRAQTTVGLYGFGGSAHIALQVARHWNCRVFVMTRGGRHRELAQEMGADWVGTVSAKPPDKLDSAILFAPAGELVVPAMQALDRGGILAVAGIYLSTIPALDYERDLFLERELRSVTANTRSDGEEFLRLAGEIPILPETTAYKLEQANEALSDLKHDLIKGAAVLNI